MGQDARKQPRAGHDYQTQLLKKREGVHLEPVLRNSAVDEPVELEAGKRDLPVGRRKPLELSPVWVPSKWIRCATRSPSPTASSTLS